MKTKTSLILGAAVLTVASISAQAQFAITGAIGFTGSATVDTAIPDATTFETFSGPSGSGSLVVQEGEGFPFGSYACVAGNTVADFNAPFDFGSPTLPFDLCSFTSCGQTYSFQINTVAWDVQITIPTIPIAYIGLGGVGTGTITGGSTTFLPTLEEWSIVDFTDTTAADQLIITIGNTAVAIPEPSTLAFAGLGSLLSIATIIRRKW